jgi:energy-coupling factor transporter transmembrane protein EcfT
MQVEKHIQMRHLAPSTRLLCGILVLVSCSASSLNNPLSRALFIVTVISWAVCCRLSRRRLMGILKWSLWFFLPLFCLFLFLLFRPGPGFRTDILHVSFALGLRAAASIIVCASTMEVLDLFELGEGLSGLPLPRVLVALILQIALQTALLTRESRRIAAALRLRGMQSAGITARMRCLFAMPVIWLLRLLLRAERVSAAMEVRGFDGPIRRTASVQIYLSDRLAITLSGLVCSMVLLLRWLNI